MASAVDPAAAAIAELVHAMSTPGPLGLLTEPPLCKVSSFLSDGQDSPSVTVRLEEPFWFSNAHIEMLVHCAQLQCMLEVETVGQHAAPRRLDEVCASRPIVHELLDALCADAETLQPGTGLMPLLDESGLSSTCPLVAHYLGDPDKVYRDESVPVVREYLEHVSSLNQLLCIARQLRADVSSGRHKYTAHKIALLYHSINSSKLARDVLRRRIEEHFEDVKEATESEERPVLPEELRTWIVVRARTMSTGHPYALPRPSCNWLISPPRSRLLTRPFPMLSHALTRACAHATAGPLR